MASLCGFGSWDIMIFAIGSLPPSACDEVLSPDELEIRLERYFQVLIAEHEIHPDLAGAIVNFLSPSSGRPFSGFGPRELARMQAGLAALAELGGLAELDHEVEEFEVENLFGAYPSPTNMELLAPLAFGPEVDGWLEVFQFLGWDATELEEAGIVGRPAYQISDTTLGRRGIQVYFIHNLPAPLFDRCISESPTVALAQYACLGHFSSNLTPRSLGFLLLSSRPQLLHRRGKSYCYLGKAYLADEKCWIDFLIGGKCKDLHELLRLNLKVKPGLVGATGLAERTDEFCKKIALLLSGFNADFEDPYDWSIVAMDTELGWSVVTAVEDCEYDDDDLAPYLLDPLDAL
ncbi:hypothetical protein [Pseudomonas mosselii]|uniref:hypothetical protein n=1 Tax=Pseudomonas mosselii TaxID=78327 RepID=UPI0021DB34F7|nr:hypothetical protein [Pseudomonas mosselii]MCU9528376.1 hypothetical protein [Pseudomonas mosselii]MCU9535549.1 hypothetical protein [Pseudomonas mosselii]MCU9547400.1 hypothetical protein [Pseudomonas mosselii]